MKLNIPTQYRIPLLVAIAIHLTLIVLLIVELPKGSGATAQRMQKSQPQIVHATAVNQTQVEQRIQQLKQQQAAKKAAELARVREMQRKAEAAKRQQLLAQKRVAALRARQLHLKEQQAKREKSLANLKKQQRAIRAQQAKALRLQQAALQKKLMQQQLRQEQQQLHRAQAAADQGLINKFSAAIKSAIAQNWRIPPSASKTLSCQYLINIGPGGVVLSAKLLRSSGDAVLDRSARTAIFKASPLPVPKNPALFDKFRQIHMTMSPKKILYN